MINSPRWGHHTEMRSWLIKLSKIGPDRTTTIDPTDWRAWCAPNWLIARKPLQKEVKWTPTSAPQAHHTLTYTRLFCLRYQGSKRKSERQSSQSSEILVYTLLHLPLYRSFTATHIGYRRDSPSLHRRRRRRRKELKFQDRESSCRRGLWGGGHEIREKRKKQESGGNQKCASVWEGGGGGW